MILTQNIRDKFLDILNINFMVIMFGLCHLYKLKSDNT